MKQRLLATMAFLCAIAMSMTAQSELSKVAQNELSKAIDEFQTNKDIAIQRVQHTLSNKGTVVANIYSFQLTEAQKPLLDKLVMAFSKPNHYSHSSKNTYSRGQNVNIGDTRLEIFEGTTVPLYNGPNWKEGPVINATGSNALSIKEGTDNFYAIKYWNLKGENEKYPHIGSIVVAQGPNDEIFISDMKDSQREIAEIQKKASKATKASTITKISNVKKASKPTTLVTMLHQIGKDTPEPTFAVLFLEKWQETLDSGEEDDIILQAILEDIDATIKNYRNKSGETPGLNYLEAASKLGHEELDKKK